MSNLNMNDLTGTFEEYEHLVFKKYPQINIDYAANIKEIIDLGIANAGNIMPDEVNAMSESIRNIEKHIETIKQSPDGWELAKFVLGEVRSISDVFDETKQRVLALTS